jgi:hypothetical protein
LIITLFLLHWGINQAAWELLLWQCHLEGNVNLEIFYQNNIQKGEVYVNQ